MLIYLIIAFVIIVLDQLSKYYVMNHLMSPIRIIEVFPSLNIIEAWNKGVSFSMLHSDNEYAPILLSLLALAIIGCLIFWAKTEEDKRVKLCIAMIIGGALGNVIDRIRFKAVYDFIDVYYKDYHWPAFNIADCGIVIGAGIIIALSLFSDTDDKKETQIKK